MKLQKEHCKNIFIKSLSLKYENSSMNKSKIILMCKS